jgi:hypothetical protein
MGGSGAQGTEETEVDELTPGNNKQDIGSKGFDDETDVLSVCHFLSYF